MEFSWRSALSRFSWDHPYLVFGLVVVLTGFMLLQFPGIEINTDPEDMLREDHPARVLDRKIEEDFFLHDMVAVALEPPEGEKEINSRRLQVLYDLVKMVEKEEGVVFQDILSVYTSDDIEAVGGSINVDQFLRSPPPNNEEVQNLIDRVEKHPVLADMVLNRETGGMALFVPIEEKKYSYSLSQSIQQFWSEHDQAEGKIHVTGLPVAEQTFGHKMFQQMATSAPMAFVVIGILMLLFFRSFSLVFWALFQAVITVLWTMGGLIGLGFEIHIMSSMISIFLLPIAVVDSIHILSDFTDRVTPDSSSRNSLAVVYEEIFFPILFTSLTSAAGFMSLSFTGIPPVRVFGLAVGSGILLAFFTTLTILPAGASLWQPNPRTKKGSESWIGRFVSCCTDCGCAVRDYPKTILAVGLVIVLLGLYGMTMIEVNDNPTRWFLSGHPIRQADKYFNNAFAGSYPAYMVLENESADGWYSPESLRELDRVTRKIQEMEEVGKTTALPGIVNKIHDELYGGEAEQKFPTTVPAVKQYLQLYENSGNPQDLFRLVTSNGQRVNVWFHLKSGDNQVMSRVKKRTEEIIGLSDLQLARKPDWGGITVVNLIWQQVMVSGMAWALASSYVVIFIMMLLLFRSFRWALLALVPLTFTLVVVYGLVGWVGKDYDMPVAVLSALSIGVAVDFAIHFIQRGRQIIDEVFISGIEEPYSEMWPEVRELISGEPSRAIARNAIVIAVGFTPLLVAPLRPYVTVGVFMMLIMALSGIATLIGLFALFETFHPYLVAKVKEE
ncbi:MAG: efflux RND transporter permease subunit [bacterium]